MCQACAKYSKQEMNKRVFFFFLKKYIILAPDKPIANVEHEKEISLIISSLLNAG